MKKLKAKLILLITGLFLSVASVPSAKAQAVVSFQFFYDELSPYGSWVSYPQYGYAWVPAAGPGFRPYLSNGHWVLTDEGWLWASNYDWGWAPFHYGSWVLDPGFGWVWVPGYQWAPAWVSWGNYDGYYGWAPIQPGFSLTISTYSPPIEYWSFMQPRYMTAENYSDHYYVAHNRRIELGSNTRVITNTSSIRTVDNITKRDNVAFNAGPRQAEFEKTANTKVQPVSIRETDKPGKLRSEGSSLSVFRPRVNQETVATEKPKKIVPAEEVKKSVNRGSSANPRNEKLSPDVNRTQQAKPASRPQQQQKERISNSPRPVQPVQQPAQKSEQRQPTERQPRQKEMAAPKEQPVAAPEQQKAIQHSPQRMQQPRRQIQAPAPPRRQPEQQNVPREQPAHNEHGSGKK